MKKAFQSIIITSLVVFGGMVPTAFAQSVDEQYEVLLEQLIVLLEERVAELSGEQTVSAQASVDINPGETCAMRYMGDESITAIQQELQNQGYTVNKIDGKVGPETRAAVTAFQTAKGATKIDGIIGQETRNLLATNAVVCKGDPNAVVLDEANEAGEDDPVTNQQCELSYKGNNDITAIQQELQNQGYTVTKIDGIIGQETRSAVTAFQTDADITIDGLIGEELRIALARNSVDCAETETTESGEPTSTPPASTSPVVEQVPTETTETNEGETDDFSVVKNDIIADVRTTTAGIPDDTAVFTYIISFVTDDTIYVPTNPHQAFEVNVVNDAGSHINTEGVSSLISSSQKILREDGTPYFLVENGDTMSLRTSIQPGAGTYYAELGRLSYTAENALTVANPAMVNYGFDGDNWRSSTVTVLN